MTGKDLKPEIIEQEISRLQARLAELNQVLEGGVLSPGIQKELVKNREHYRSLFNAVSGGVMVYDKNGTIVEANDIACEILGFERNPETGLYLGNSHHMAVDIEGEALSADQHPSKVTLQTGQKIHGFVMGVCNSKDEDYTWIVINSEPVFDEQTDEVTAAVSTFIEVSEQKKLVEELEASENRYRQIFEHMSNGVTVLEPVDDGAAFIFRDFNAAAEIMDTVNRMDIIGRPMHECYPGVDEFGLPEILRRVMQSGKGEHYGPLLYQDAYRQMWREGFVYRLPNGHLVVTYADITERMLHQKEQEATIELLRLVNTSENLPGLLRSVSGFLREFAACDAVGIRLVVGESMPYYESSGFSEGFLDTDCDTCMMQCGQESGSSVLKNCFCGRVVTGNIDTRQSFFTTLGSFYTGSTSEVIESLHAFALPDVTCRHCHTFGYESVVLIPLRFKGEILGLLQFNSRRKGAFSPDFISVLERLANHLAVGVTQQQHFNALNERVNELRCLYGISRLNEAHGQPLDELLQQVVEVIPTGFQSPGQTTARLRLRDREYHSHDFAPSELVRTAEISLWGQVEGDVEVHVTNHNAINSAQPFLPEEEELLQAIAERVGRMVERIEAREELRHSEAQLRASEAFLKTLMDSIPVPLFHKDTQGRYTGCNPAFEEFFGESKAAILNKSVFDICPPELAEIYHAKDVELFETPGVQIYDSQVENSHGEMREVVFHKATLTDDAGKATGLVGAILDITDRTRAERALAMEKERLAVTLRSIGDAVIATNTEGNLVILNRIAEKLTGWTEKEALGRHISEVFHIVNENTLEVCENPVVKVLETGKIIGLANHTMLIAKDGARYSIADSGAPIRDADSNIVGVVLVFRDVTEEQKMREEAAKVQKLESLGLLAGGIAHDFNNILTTALGNLQLARLFPRDDEKHERNLINAEQACLQARELTERLLTFSRGGAPVKKVASLVDIVCETADFALSGSKIRCRYSIEPDLQPVEVDPSQIHQVIHNLIINAEQAMPQGGTLEIDMKNVIVKPGMMLPLPEGHYVYVHIKDEGVGIAPEHLPRIFDPYFTTKQKGSGLGLASTYSIIKQHQGHISVQSHLGEGTTFSIYLPATDKIIQAVDQDVENRLPRGTGRVLIMDDDETVLKLGRLILNELGYEVEIAEEGGKAIEMYCEAREQGSPFDVVILDLTVKGGMGGVDACSQLRSIDPNVRAVICSGYSASPIMSQYDKHGFVGMVKKPYEVRELAVILKDLCEKD